MGGAGRLPTIPYMPGLRLPPATHIGEALLAIPALLLPAGRAGGHGLLRQGCYITGEPDRARKAGVTTGNITPERRTAQLVWTDGRTGAGGLPRQTPRPAHTYPGKLLNHGDGRRPMPPLQTLPSLAARQTRLGPCLSTQEEPPMPVLWRTDGG